MNIFGSWSAGLSVCHKNILDRSHPPAGGRDRGCMAEVSSSAAADGKQQREAARRRGEAQFNNGRRFSEPYQVEEQSSFTAKARSLARLVNPLVLERNSSARAADRPGGTNGNRPVTVSSDAYDSPQEPSIEHRAVGTHVPSGRLSVEAKSRPTGRRLVA
ncbi:hypothetical protein EVAR_98585_1 [Eumeta japonica]|uniref:Uncharacterized protein n=1 Tax=Eumeta variegata TaxID=151549 RepID=A0A4C1T418_EUMVA|nr:hypothetical protein EVAR_98585_1 [Eumeta japonica]